MQRFTCSVAVLVLSAAGLSHAPAPAADPSPAKAPAQHTKESLQKLYLGYLTQLGYKPKLDADGDVEVRIEGSTFYLYVRPETPNRFGMVNWIMTLGKGENPLPVLRAADATNEATRVAKVVLMPNNVVYAVAELRVTKPEDARDLLPLVIERLQEGRKGFEDHRAAQKAAAGK